MRQKTREVQFGQEGLEDDQIKCHKISSENMSQVLCEHAPFRRQLVRNVFGTPF
jgi:hypothetical protein